MENKHATTAAAAIRSATSDYDPDAHSSLAEIWKFVEADVLGFRREARASRQSQMVAAENLASKPLWLEGEPPKEILREWEDLKAALLRLNQNWEVWTDWYEDRLYGRAANEDIEIARMLEISEDEWEQGPRVVNDKIKKIIERYRADAEGLIPPQLRSALRFGGRSSDPIDILPAAEEGEGLDSRQSRCEDYDELRHKAEELAGHGQRLGQVRSAVNRFLQLPHDLPSVRAKLLWSRFNSLRLRL